MVRPSIHAMESTWSRDLSVLETVVRLCDENEWGAVEPQEIADHLAMDTNTVKRALWKLAKSSRRCSNTATLVPSEGET